METQTPRLSHDILFTLIPFLENEELINFSTVCRLYRVPVLRQLLSSVNIHTWDKLVNFCACILLDVSVRAPWIKSMNIDADIPAVESQDRIVATDMFSISALARVLEHCHELTSLRIPSLGSLIVASERIDTSIAPLRNLKTLDL